MAMRRHLVGLLLALGVLAMLFFGTAWSVGRIVVLRGTVTALGTQNALTSTRGLIAVGVLVATGLVLGIFLAAPAISPLATGLPGLILLGWSALVVIHSRYAVRYLPMPGSHFTTGLTYLLFNGVLGLIGAAMIIPMLVPSRWRSRREYVDERDEDDNVGVHTALGLIP
jgi:predicted Kef-type K+ transport protein